MSRDISHYLANLNSLDPLDFATSASGGAGSSSNNQRGGGSQGPNGGGPNGGGPGARSPNGVQGHLADDDLAIFSNTDFYDFDVGHSTNLAVTVDDLLMQQERQVQGKKYPRNDSAQHFQHLYEGNGNNTNNNTTSNGNSSTFGFQALEQYSIANELAPYSHHHPHHNLHAHNAPHPYGSGGSGTGASTSSATPASGNTPQDMTGHQNELLIGNGAGANGSSVSSSSYMLDGTVGSSNDRKRKASVMDLSSSPSLDNDTKNAADEDKRKRNTAASARFRIKKKLREQEMEREAQELREKVQSMETKVMQLEMENKWLKNLVVERNEARDVNDLDELRKRVLGVAKDPKGKDIKTGVKSE